MPRPHRPSRRRCPHARSRRSRRTERMIRVWTSSLRVTPREVDLLVQDEEMGDLVKARLPLAPRHPRALLTLLEGVALWRGQPLRVVLSAGGPSVPWLGSDLFGDELWPGE